MRSFFIRMVQAVVSLYLVFLFGWAALHALDGDRWWWMFFINSFVPYYFLPLPVAVVVAVLSRHRVLLAATGAAALLFVWLYGGLFVPRGSSAQAATPTLSVLEYNLLGYNKNVDGIVAALRASNADVIGLQELNPQVAEAIERELQGEYPYQFLTPQPGVRGSGVISRYPMQPADSTPTDLHWVGEEQLFRLDFAGTEVLLLHFHAIPPLVGDPTSMTWVIRERERQAESLAAFAHTTDVPLILAGDFNATDMSDAYAILTQQVKDSWREAGYGLGHTFPGTTSARSSRLCSRFFCVPMWMVRIDYVFHTDAWETVSAEIGPWDGGSDHRPVLVTLQLKDASR